MTGVSSMAGSNLIVFVMLFFYLVLHTGIASMMILDKEGQSIDTISLDMGKVNPVIDSDLGNPVINKSLHGATQYSGIWQIQDDGSYILIDASVSTGIEPTLVIDNVLPQNGIYTNEYLIQNTPQTRFNIIIRKAASLISFTDDIILVFDTDAIYIPSNLFIGEDYHYNYPNLLQNQEMKIKTVFDSNANTLEIYLNDNWIDTVSNLHALTMLSISHFYYCGVQSYDINFQWKTISTIIGTNTNTDFLSVAGKFFNTVYSLYNFMVPSEYYPIPLLRAILFDVPLIGLIVFGIMVFRGD